MSHGFGPWSSSLSEGAPGLSTFWKRRMTRLPETLAARPDVSRREWLQLAALGTAACAVPTLRRASAQASPRPAGLGTIYLDANFSTGSRYDADLDGLWAVDPATGDRKRVPGAVPGANARASRDGKSLALIRAGRTGPGVDIENVGVWTLDLQAGGPPIRVSDFGGVTSWSPDGRQLIVVKWFNPPDPEPAHHETWRFDLDGSKPVRLPIPETDEVDDWSPNGRWLVTVSDRHEPRGSGYQLYLMRPDGSEQRRLTEGRGLNVYPRFSPDGRWIAYLRQERGKNDIRVIGLEGGGPRILVEETKEGPDVLLSPDKVAWSPDGKTLACALRAMDVHPDGPPSRKIPGENTLNRVVLVDVETKEARPLKLPGMSWINGLDWQ
ncbi:PD40 domain-containing protein [Paludisphaera soli]|uniref:PD40 domain-containing protein n=1 Tax=Paludisphaera soli TaxID=2712865 RepID=UPI0013EB4750|nr:PD40 domain-containing protein [Paludisphaera soli]